MTNKERVIEALPIVALCDDCLSVQNEYQIRTVADTASRTTGKDIIALTPDGKKLWISVKGYPFYVI